MTLSWSSLLLELTWCQFHISYMNQRIPHNCFVVKKTSNGTCLFLWILYFSVSKYFHSAVTAWLLLDSLCSREISNSLVRTHTKELWKRANERKTFVFIVWDLKYRWGKKTCSFLFRLEKDSNVCFSVPLAAEVPSLAAYTPCRYGASCTRVGCLFKHPKECRFGVACMNTHCLFYHTPSAKKAAAPPISSTIGQYKWQAKAVAPASST